MPDTPRPRLVLRRGTWCIAFYEGNLRRRIATGTSDETRARQYLADFEAGLERRASYLTVATALDRYSASREGKILALDRITTAANALKEGMGKLRVDQVNQKEWDRYAANRLTRPRPSQNRATFKPQPVSTGTKRREYVVLRAALNMAWKDGYLPRQVTIEPPPDSAPRDRYLTQAEARKLIDAAETPHVKLFVAIAAFTGARRSSILALTWDRVDFATGMIDFQEPGRQITAKRRAINPISEELLGLLRDAHRMRQSEHVIEYDGKAVPHGIRWPFKRICKKAGLTWVPTPHHFKHSVASWMAMNNVPIDTAADWLATSQSTIKRTYRKFDPTYLRSAMHAVRL